MVRPVTTRWDRDRPFKMPVARRIRFLRTRPYYYPVMGRVQCPASIGSIDRRYVHYPYRPNSGDVYIFCSRRANVRLGIKSPRETQEEFLNDD